MAVAVVVKAGTRATAASPGSTAVVWPAAAVVHVESWRMLLAAHGSGADVAVWELRLHWKTKSRCQHAMKTKKGGELQQVSFGMRRGSLKGLVGLCLDPQS